MKVPEREVRNIQDILSAQLNKTATKLNAQPRNVLAVLANHCRYTLFEHQSRNGAGEDVGRYAYECYLVNFVEDMATYRRPLVVSDMSYQRWIVAGYCNAFCLE